MRLKKLTWISVFLMLFALTFNQQIFSATASTTYTGNLKTTIEGNWTNDITNLQSILADSFAVSFATTDLIGSTKIKTFEFGVAVTGGFSNTTLSDTAGSLPATYGGAGGAIHFGFDGGLISDSLEDWDLILRLFFLPEITVDQFKIKAFSIGVKPRWHIVGNASIWGGLTLSLALDYTNITATVSNITGALSFSDAGGATQTGNINSGNLDLEANLFTITPEIMTNLDLYILTPYIAGGAVFNLGNFDVNGTINTTIVSQGVGTTTLTGSEGGKGVVPYLRAGLEFNISVVKLTFQGIAAFATETFLGGGIGLRLEI